MDVIRELDVADERQSLVDADRLAASGDYDAREDVDAVRGDAELEDGAGDGEILDRQVREWRAEVCERSTYARRSPSTAAPIRRDPSCSGAP
ncbi:MAG: hypothetical protein KF850_22040 [Labilithrix sp.]|nr:hypothetical protein [Labilithrix sp.]MBX3214733.1 hypothetical protein [Labilithrix sp.]